MATIEDLAQLRDRLRAELAKVNAEIARRAGEVDAPKSAKPRSRSKTTAKKD